MVRVSSQTKEFTLCELYRLSAMKLWLIVPKPYGAHSADLTQLPTLNSWSPLSPTGLARLINLLSHPPGK
jgi:hypothetical protein